jgi:cell division protein FtsW (lipid II flippase)
LIKAAAVVGFPLILIMLQPDLGTALVLLPLAAVGAYLAGLQWKHALAMLALAAVMVPVGYHFLEALPEGTCYNIPAAGRGSPRRGLSDPAIEDRRGFRRILG